MPVHKHTFERKGVSAAPRWKPVGTPSVPTGRPSHFYAQSVGIHNEMFLPPAAFPAEFVPRTVAGSMRPAAFAPDVTAITGPAVSGRAPGLAALSALRGSRQLPPQTRKRIRRRLGGLGGIGGGFNQ